MTRLLSLAAAAALLVAPALAQDGRAAQQVKLRQSVYIVLGSHFSQMGAMVQGRTPYDAANFRTAAERVAFMATIAPDMFPAGSLSSTSKAKPEIWQNSADFQVLMKDLRDKSAALATASRSGGLDAARPAFIAAAGTCKACHDKYKLD
ncbi:MAG: c-type cytochrome [Steroidobacteraceae bacterium]